jgi:hypothetical protein
LACGLASCTAAGAAAQEVPRGWSAYDLPRVGYEPRHIEIGRFVLAPELAISENYDSNVFATHDGEETDFLTLLSPRLRATTAADKLELSTDLFADVRRYRDNDTENTTSYGGAVRGDYQLTPSQRFTFSGLAGQDFEARGAPDEQRGTAQGPAAFDYANVSLGYRYKRNRLGLAASGRVNRVDFLEQEEGDKDLSLFRGALRASYLLTPRFDAFVQTGVDRRDHRLEADRSGRDRDAQVYSVLGGVAVDIAGTVTGEFGAGMFHSTFEDPAFESANGFAMNGSITWAVAQRTSLTASASREDVSTIRASAASNVQTQLGLRIEQEVFHNLLASANVQAVENKFEGSDQTEEVVALGGLLEYFINRGVSVFGSARYITQSADAPTDEYNRYVIAVGARLRY